MASTRLLSNIDQVENLTRTDPSLGHKSSASVDGGRYDTEAHAEYLRALKRRSLPHLPKRSSSLTLPPVTPPSDSPPSSPIEAPLSRKEWGLWLREFLNGRRPTPPPAIDEYIMVDDREGVGSLDDNNDAIMPKARDWGSSTDASEGDPLPAEKPLSRRYCTLLKDLWRRRPRIRLPITAHPLIHTRHSQRDEAQERGYNAIGEADNLLPNLNRPFQVSAVREVNPNAANVRLDRDTVSVPPSSPRPAFRQLPSSINNNVHHEPHPSSSPMFPCIASATNRVLSGFQRLNESFSLLQAQQILDAALLLNFRMGRTLSDLASAATAASPLSSGESDDQESASLAHAAIDTAKADGNEGLATEDANSGLFQGNMATPVPHRSLGKVQGQKGLAAPIMDSSGVITDGASSSAMGSTRETSIRWVDVNDQEEEEDFAPLQRVRSHRPPR